MENKTVDLVAKLLANENITVVHGNVSTASFNIETRILTLPMWKEMSADLTGMLVGHEVGHALFTTTEFFEHDVKNRLFFGYLNVLEDVRIEKFMKRLYPGLRKTFIAGYKELNDMDFFGINSQDLSELNLIDKINLYFKAGYNCGVTFSKKEKQFVDRAEKLETIQEVIQLAKELFQEAKDKQQEEKEALKAVVEEAEEDEDGEEQDSDDDQGAGDSDEDDEETSDEEGEDESGDDESDEEGEDESDEEGEDESDEEGEDESETSEEVEPDMDSELASSTDMSYQEKVAELTESNTTYEYWELQKFSYNPIVTHKELNKFFAGRTANTTASSFRLENLDKLKQNSSRVVNYLIKEFEMKKAATAYKRATISKTGRLDMSKVYNYKLSDDIFKRVSMVKDGKNHGMIILVDWSGSMQKCIDNTVDQVVNLAMFCQRSQIPYQVFAFSTAFATAEYTNRPKLDIANIPKGVLEVNNSNLSLLELFSNTMSGTEFNTMVSNLKLHLAHLRLGFTPLNESLAFMNEYIPTFKQKFNVEKMTFITLTDGQGDMLTPVGGDSYRGLIWDKDGSRVSVKNFIRNPNNKKDYLVATSSTSQTNVLLTMIKDSHDVTVLGFFITKIANRELSTMLNATYDTVRNADVTIARIKKEIKDHGFASLKGTGRDDLFVVPADTKIKERSLNGISGDKSARQIASQFGKALNVQKTSRVLLNNFIAYIA